MSSSSGRTWSRSSAAYSLSVVPISVDPSHGSANIAPPPPAGRYDRAGRERQGLARERDVRAARGADPRHLGLVVELLGAQPVRPHAGGVDDVLRAHLEALAGVPVADADAARAPAVVEQV